MLNNIYLITGIIVALFTLTTMMLTAFLWLNKSFRDYLTTLLEKHDKENKDWTKTLFLDYYYALDERLTNLNYRLKGIEKKCLNRHEKNND